MRRDTKKLQHDTFDVLVIGGGIHGAAAARECASRGLKTALIEKSDFGNATSANSMKIIHGGLRYLQHLNIKRMRESIVSRRMMLKLAPHNVKPLGCVIGNSGYGLQSNLVMRIGLMLNDCIAFDRNKGVDGQSRIPRGTILPLTRCKELFPSLDWTGMTGASLWYDAIALNSDRLVLAFVKGAVGHGAQVANYVAMDELLVENGQVAGCRATDLLTGDMLTISARAAVITGGAWNNALLGTVRATEAPATHFAKAVNIIVRKSLTERYAFGLTGEVNYQDKDAVFKKKGRFFFFVPWRGYTMIGTTYTRYDGSLDQVRATRRDIEELLAEVNAIYPPAALTVSDVTNVHAGLLPLSSLDSDKYGNVQVEKETMIIGEGDGLKTPAGLLSVKSVKYTTAPVVAAQTCDRLSRLLGEKTKKPVIAETQAPAAMQGSPRRSAGFDYLDHRYGAEAGEVFACVQKNPEMVSVAPPLCLGEIDYFIEEEMALTVSDVVFRRSELATAECPPAEVLQAIADYLGKRLAWSQQKIESEIEEVTSHFIWS